MYAEVDDAFPDDFHGAEESAATATEANDLPSDTIFLVGEFEGSEGGSAEVGVGGGYKVEAKVSDKELDVGRCEGSCVGG